MILAIFQRHARSREARLQVEIARLSYWAPRVRESSGGKDRQGGGIGGRGAGESHLELDRRKLRDRIAELRAEIASIDREAGVRRQRREEQNKVALVGYTNAGKSSLMRALTGSGVAVADRLFATLDTTIRSLHSGDEAPHPGLRHGGASSRSSPTSWSPPSARPSTRPAMRTCSCTSSTPRTPPFPRRSR